MIYGLYYYRKERKFLRCASVRVIFNHRTTKGLLVSAQHVGPRPRTQSGNGISSNRYEVNGGRQTAQSACPPAKWRVKSLRDDGIVGILYKIRRLKRRRFFYTARLLKKPLTLSVRNSSSQPPKKRATYSLKSAEEIPAFSR